jgi:hypothetical protein
MFEAEVDPKRGPSLHDCEYAHAQLGVAGEALYCRCFISPCTRSRTAQQHVQIGGGTGGQNTLHMQARPGSATSTHLARPTAQRRGQASARERGTTCCSRQLGSFVRHAPSTAGSTAARPSARSRTRHDEAGPCCCDQLGSFAHLLQTSVSRPSVRSRTRDDEADSAAAASSAACQLTTTGAQLPAPNYQLTTTSPQLPAPNYQLPAIICTDTEDARFHTNWAGVFEGLRWRTDATCTHDMLRVPRQRKAAGVVL